MMKKRVYKKGNKRKNKGNKLNDNEKEELSKYEKKGKRCLCNNLDDEKKNILKKRRLQNKKKSLITFTMMKK